MSLPLFDPGLQPERTELAWTRTALAIAVGSLVALRVLPALAGYGVQQVLWMAPGLVGLAFAICIRLLARSRYSRVNRALLFERPGDLPGASLLLALALFAISCGICATAVVIVAGLI